MKKPDMLVPVAIWEFLTALGILIPMSAMFIVLFGNANYWGMWTGSVNMPNLGILVNVVIGFAQLLFLTYFILALMGGIWLLQGREMGRILSIVHAALSLLFVPVGTVIGALVLVYLTKPEVRDYFQK